VSFSEIADEKRIALLEDNKLSFLPITSKPMHLIDLYGNNGKVSARGFKQIKDKNIDLKIRAITDSISIQELQRNIYKIKNYFNVEYYQEEIKIQEIKSDIPKSLNQLDLLKDYCTTKKINFNLVEKEIGNDRSYC